MKTVGQTVERQQYREQNVPLLCLNDCVPAIYLPSFFLFILFSDCIVI